MSFFTILQNLFLGPLTLIFEFIYVIANRVVDHPGLSIIVLSLVMNILVLPLYRRADAIQAQARDMEAKLQDGVAHIKKVFSGDERMMILQTYYRQNNYRPTDALHSSVSLLLQIPFFMAAYQFLSTLEMLKHVPLGPIADLSAPDGLLVIGSLTINLLPILMTIVNVVSSAIYLKGFPLKQKLQLYGMAGLFLVLLYDSPSGLVFYWTLNNLFSLVKNIFYRLKHAKAIGIGLLSLGGLAVLAFGLFLYHPDSWRRKIFILGIGVMLQLPLVLQLLKGKISLPVKHSTPRPNQNLFLLGSLFLTVLTGILIPSTFIAASPQEFVDITYFHHPLLYLVTTGCLGAGTFLIWLRVFYWLAGDGVKVLFERLVWVLCGVMLINYMFFGTDLGVLSADLQYVDGMDFSGREQIMNLAVIAVTALVMYLFCWKWSRYAVTILLVAVITLGAMSIPNIVTTSRSVASLDIQSPVEEEEAPNFTLSKNGKNVIVVMLDRGLGQTLPFLVNEKPELKEQFDGFTFYDNTISFGGYTNFGAPALMGGYEYTPVELNKRSNESLREKHNEALLVMPVLFSENGFDVTVLDPPYANYQWVPDLSIYNDYPEIQAYITKTMFVGDAEKQMAIDMNHRNFFCFSLMKTMPLFLQPNIYSDGTYNSSEGEVNVQTQINTSKARGYLTAFMNAYSLLSNLNPMTQVSDSTENTFLFMDSQATHEAMLLQTPDYVPAETVDNTQYDAAHSDRFTIDGRTLDVSTANQMAHYHSNMAALLKLGQWLDYLRENDLYDNSRIILVADHGRNLSMEETLIMDSAPDTTVDVSLFYPLLMVKDFGSTGFHVSHDFMTHADTPMLAMEGLIENPVNPFTGKPLTSDEKTAHPQYIIRSSQWDVSKNNGTTFLPDRWASITEDLWKEENWEFYETNTVLDTHGFPPQG